MKKPRCGPKTRRGTPCQASAIWSTRSQRYTRCRNHGGLSTGPKTAGGIERIRRAVTKHGRYSGGVKKDRGLSRGGKLKGAGNTEPVVGQACHVTDDNGHGSL